MSEILNYLNSPHLVANFQKIFGIESQFKNSTSENVITNSNGTESHKLVKKLTNDNGISSNHKSECNSKTSVFSQNQEPAVLFKQSTNDINSKNINGLNNITNKLEAVSPNNLTKRHLNTPASSSAINTSGYSLRSRQIEDSLNPDSENDYRKTYGHNKPTSPSHNQKEQIKQSPNSQPIVKTVSNGKAKLDDTNDIQQQQSKTNNNEDSHHNKHAHHRRQLSQPKKFVNITDHTHIVSNTTIHSRFWYYFFRLGAAMGNEIFYCLFFPFWFWNVDGAIARKAAFLWGIFMYVGQATKDIMCMPRPASPPVVKLEERYMAEYGFPSTHAMVSAGLPISVVVLSYSRYNINLPISISIAGLFCLWVCCSRLYLGMHSLLDVIAGTLYALLVLIIVMPILEPIDTFMIENNYSPYLTLIVGYALCHFYPSLKQWSTARGDTAIIIGSVVGFSVGAYLNNNFGFLNKPDEPPLYEIRFPNAIGYVFGVVRTILGLVILLAIRQIAKLSLFSFLCKINGLDPKSPDTKKEKKIELPYYYFSYFAIGVNVAFFSPYLFRLLNIERDYSYTEL
jgi:sphingosine-1-phosphate phosphatase 1